MKKLLFFLFFSLALCLEAKPLHVEVETRSPLKPLYLTGLSGVEGEWDEAYLSALEEVFRFDLDQGGAALLLERTEQRERSAHRLLSGNESGFSLADADCVVKPEIKGRSFSALVLDLERGSLFSLQEHALSGNLASDRRVIHLASDAIHQALIGKPGICSTRILYTLKKGPSQDVAEVWEMDYDGENARPLTQEKALCVTPVYLPPLKGRQAGCFAYVSYKTGQPKMMIASLKEARAKRISLLRGNQLMPAFCKQRDRLAFISDAAGNPDLFLAPFDPESGQAGKPRQLYTLPYATEGSPAWSPDGKRLAFVSNKDGLARIYLLDLAEPTSKSKPKLLTKRYSECTAPAWSPDGSKIAYSSKIQGVRQICMLELSSGKETQVTFGPSDKENPSWAPNSLSLVYNTSSKESAELYLIHLYKARSKLISKGFGLKRFPSWEPRE